MQECPAHHVARPVAALVVTAQQQSAGSGALATPAYNADMQHHMSLTDSTGDAQYHLATHCHTADAAATQPAQQHSTHNSTAAAAAAALHFLCGPAGSARPRTKVKQTPAEKPSRAAGPIALYMPQCGCYSHPTSTLHYATAALTATTSPSCTQH